MKTGWTKISHYFCLICYLKVIYAAVDTALFFDFPSVIKTVDSSLVRAGFYDSVLIVNHLQFLQVSHLIQSMVFYLVPGVISMTKSVFYVAVNWSWVMKYNECISQSEHIITHSQYSLNVQVNESKLSFIFIHS